MTLVTIINTTDGYHLGFEFESEDPYVILPNDSVIFFERKVDLTYGTRFINSNYIIEAIPADG